MKVGQTSFFYRLNTSLHTCVTCDRYLHYYGILHDVSW